VVCTISDSISSAFAISSYCSINPTAVNTATSRRKGYKSVRPASKLALGRLFRGQIRCVRVFTRPLHGVRLFQTFVCHGTENFFSFSTMMQTGGKVRIHSGDTVTDHWGTTVLHTAEFNKRLSSQVLAVNQAMN
jgi:hypothetical protein